ncbi:MAG: 3-carboxy-cis,cis-muconate cycloisomerase [Acidimicrobiales bacterium]
MACDLLALLTTTDELADATSDRAWLAAMLRAEEALAGAEAEAGVIPAEAAAAIAGACDPALFDPVSVARRGRRAANPVVPLVADLRAAAGPHAGPWAHWGATSQDILDTAAMLVCRSALAIVERDLASLAASGATLARTHRDTPMAARTLLQQAAPTTFGLKAAGWMVAAMDAGAGLARLRPRLAAQLGGAAGTMAALGPAGPAVLSRFAGDLGLAEPLLPWHTSRGRVAEIAAALAVASGAAAKVALDVVLLSQSEVAEVSEREAGTSSAMPHKRNPSAAVTAIAAAHRARGLTATVLGAMPQEHERAAGAWQAEWATLSDLLAAAGGAVAYSGRSLTNLDVHPGAMRANLDRAGGVLQAETVALALRRAGVPADVAAAAVGAAAARTAGGATFAGSLASDPAVAGAIGGALDEALDEATHLRSAGSLVDRALRAYDKREAP